MTSDQHNIRLSGMKIESQEFRNEFTSASTKSQALIDGKCNSASSQIGQVDETQL